MKRLLLSLLSLLILSAGSARAEVESVNEIKLKQDEVISTGHWHGLTFKCHLDEDDEIETTPGSPPLDVDDPSTPGCNKWEINIVMDGDLHHSKNEYELPLFDINYGIGDNLQLKYEVPNTVSSDRHGSLGDSKIGVKFQFYGNEESRLQMAVYPQLLLSSSNQAAAADEPSSRGTVTTLPFLITRRLAKTKRGDIMMTANLGYNISTRPDTLDFVSAAVGVGAPFIKSSSILMELATEQAARRAGDDPRQQLLKLDVAATVPLNKNFLLFGSLGHSLIASDELDHSYVLTGFRWLPSL